MKYTVKEYMESPSGSKAADGDDGHIIGESDSFTDAINSVIAWLHAVTEYKERPIRSIELTESGVSLFEIDKRNKAAYRLKMDAMEIGEIVELINAWEYWDPRMLEALGKACKVSTNKYKRPNGAYDTVAYDKAINKYLKDHGYHAIDWN